MSLDGLPSSLHLRRVLAIVAARYALGTVTESLLARVHVIVVAESS